jgi:CRP/FNR family cyclic AMP-dependent transcriptional regulator
METIELLRNHPLFCSLPPALLESLAHAATQRSYAEGQTIFRFGDPPDHLYLVASGAVDVLVPAQAGEIVVASFCAGSFFGELAAFDRQPRSASARAVAASELVCVPLDAVQALIDHQPAAARQLLGAIAQRLRGADEMLSRLRIRNVNELAEARMSLGERVADRVARFGGSWTFIICFGVFLLAWMLVNTTYLLSQPPDPFPYIFLNLMLSCLAAIQAPVIMMSQNRQAAKDRLQADQEFEINVKAEIAVQQLHRKVDELRALMLQHLQAREPPRS